MTTPIRELLAGALMIALVAGACGGPRTPDISAAPASATTAVSSEPSASVNPGALRYVCGTFTLAPDLLTAGPGNDEEADNPAAVALRAHLALSGPDFEFLPDTGWHMVGFNDRHAEFISVGADGEIATVGVDNGPNGWMVSGWGDCQPRVALGLGLGAADWAFDPDQLKPDPTTQVFDALVTEMSCNSGQPADGRIVGPQIISTADTVLVVFAVRPRPGGQDCQGNPATRVTVDLGEPLGNRALLDGGRLPPRDPAIAPF